MQMLESPAKRGFLLWSIKNSNLAALNLYINKLDVSNVLPFATLSVAKILIKHTPGISENRRFLLPFTEQL